MKDKYYIPELTEFRIGFRFEEYAPGSNTEHIKRIYSVEHFNFVNNLYSQNLQEGWIRVAYLSEEDILSLGFVKINEYKSSTEYTLNNCYLQLWSNRDVLIWTKGNMNTLFSGQVKNINELEVILKQVRI